jgi:hypothetical protein
VRGWTFEEERLVGRKEGMWYVGQEVVWCGHLSFLLTQHLFLFLVFLLGPVMLPFSVYAVVQGLTVPSGSIYGHTPQS